MDDDAIERVLMLADERGLSHANLGMFESNGSYRSKRYNIRHLKKAMTDGIAWIAVPSGLDPADGIIMTNPFVDPARGYRDGVIRMDPNSCRETPFDSGGMGLLLMGDFTGDLADHCVRALLSRELERLDALGFEVYGGLEIEGAVLAETPETFRSKRPADVQTLSGFDKVYSFTDQSIQAELIDDLVGACDVMGMPLDTAHAEFTYMLEVGMQPSVGLRIADNAALYKSVAKIVAARHGAYVTFMARRSAKEQGCGAHINLSLRDKDTHQSVFYDGQQDHRLSDTMRHFIGGLHRYLPELYLLLAPHLNSYKRYQEGLFTPLTNTWGINNKTVAFRAVNATPAACRVEVRTAGADVSPHLALLAVIAAGRLGIEERIEPPPPVEGSGYAVEEVHGSTLPLKFEEAIDRFEASAVAREITSEGFHAAFVGDRRWQVEAFARAVTDWELALFGNL